MFIQLLSIHGGISGDYNGGSGYTSISDFISILRIVKYYLDYPLSFFDITVSIGRVFTTTIALFIVYSTIRNLFVGGD